MRQRCVRSRRYRLRAAPVPRPPYDDALPDAPCRPIDKILFNFDHSAF